MTPDPKKTIEEQLLDQVLEFILEAPEDEFLQYLKDSGEDPVELAREGREAIAAALKRYGQEKLVAARHEHNQQAAEIKKLSQGIPTDLSEKQSLLAKLMERAQLAGHKVSFQNRDFREAAPEDLDQAIAQIIALLARGQRK